MSIRTKYGRVSRGALAAIVVLMCSATVFLVVIASGEPDSKSKTCISELSHDQLKLLLLDRLSLYPLYAKQLGDNSSLLLQERKWQVTVNEEYGNSLSGSEEWNTRYQIFLTHDGIRYYGYFDDCGNLVGAGRHSMTE